MYIFRASFIYQKKWNEGICKRLWQKGVSYLDWFWEKACKAGSKIK